MRTFVAAPKAEGTFPGIWCCSDIFQLTPPMLRACVRLAGYGFVAAAPEIYRRIEPPGTAIRLTMRGGRAAWGMRPRLRWRISTRIAERGWIGWGKIRKLRGEKLERWGFALADIWRFGRRFSRM